MRSAVQGVRSVIFRRCATPSSKMDLAAQPVLAYTVRMPSMDDEALSWFCGQHRRKRLLSICAAVPSRVGGPTGRWPWS